MSRTQLGVAVRSVLAQGADRLLDALAVVGVGGVEVGRDLTFRTELLAVRGA
ncbi:hypothetical protein [Streptomyces sp. NPDC000880]